MSFIDIAKKIIKEYEGLRLESYLCPAGFWTIGWGHTAPDIKKGMKITETQAEFYLAYDIQYFSNVVKRYVKVPLNDNQMAALVSFTFNLGDQRLKSSTLLKIINAGNFDQAALEFLKWDKATVDGKLISLNGLTKRRKEESETFKVA